VCGREEREEKEEEERGGRTWREEGGGGERRRRRRRRSRRKRREEWEEEGVPPRYADAPPRYANAPPEARGRTAAVRRCAAAVRLCAAAVCRCTAACFFLKTLQVMFGHEFRSPHECLAPSLDGLPALSDRFGQEHDGLFSCCVFWGSNTVADHERETKVWREPGGPTA
jgi:hypothetical protein